MNLSKAISLLLTLRNMSQKSLAEKANISTNSISSIMKNHTTPRRETINAIADALDVRPEFLDILSFTREDVPDGRKELYDFVWPQMEKTFIKLFVN